MATLLFYGIAIIFIIFVLLRSCVLFCVLKYFDLIFFEVFCCILRLHASIVKPLIIMLEYDRIITCQFQLFLFEAVYLKGNEFVILILFCCIIPN